MCSSITIYSYRDSDSTAFNRPYPSSKKVKYLGTGASIFSIKNAGLNSWYCAVGTCERGPVTLVLIRSGKTTTRSGYVPFSTNHHPAEYFGRVFVIGIIFSS